MTPLTWVEGSAHFVPATVCILPISPSDPLSSLRPTFFLLYIPIMPLSFIMSKQPAKHDYYVWSFASNRSHSTAVVHCRALTHILKKCFQKCCTRMKWKGFALDDTEEYLYPILCACYANKEKHWDKCEIRRGPDQTCVTCIMSSTLTEALIFSCLTWYQGVIARNAVRIFSLHLLRGQWHTSYILSSKAFNLNPFRTTPPMSVCRLMSFID